MKKTVSGNVICHDITGSRAMRRYVEKYVSKWVQSLQAMMGLPLDRPPRYRVDFMREGEGHFVNCRVEVQFGQQVWRGYDYGSGSQQAVLHCLEHMRQSMALPMTSAPLP